MKPAKEFARSLLLTGIIGSCIFAALLPSDSQAQSSKGKNAICASTSGCSTTTASQSFIDASVFAATGVDFCGVLNGILISTSYSTSVIDARGLPGATGTSMTCTSGTPWNNGSSFINKPSTILLPAGTITIPSAWVLPNGTHLVGEGDNPSYGSTIRATFSSGGMIQMGTSCPTPGCTAISIENLILDGNKNGVDGIVNQNAQDLSYVDHVALYQILGTGLSISSSSNNSGPYTNIAFDTGGGNGTTLTHCLNINGTTGIKGVHGLNCVSRGITPAPAGILLDASSNSIEDVRIVGFDDGIRIGSVAIAESNVLINILGDTVPAVPSPIYVVHIENAGYTVSDLTVLGASNSGVAGTYTIHDDVTSTDLSDSSVAMYIVGKQADGGYSRFTTSPNAPTWATGTNSPTGSCTKGSVFSCSGSSSSCGSHVLYGCPSGSSWTEIY
jgi:hypothetical protein